MPRAERDSLGRDVARLLREATRRDSRQGLAPRRFDAYRSDPVGYCKDVLKVSLTGSQEKIARLLLQPPHRVLVPAAHNTGKSYLAACMASWHFDCRGGATLTTAPTDRQVKGILWKELRRVRARAGLHGFPGPKMPRLEGPDGRWAHGFTARDATGFHGQHESAVFIVFDEAEGVSAPFWEAAETMRGPGDPMLCIYNPVRQDTQAYTEESLGGWHVEPLSALDHPNIRAELQGLAPPYPSAIRLARLREQLTRWGTPVPQEQASPKDGDVMLAPGEWYRPGPVAEARCLGRRPSRAVNSVWSRWAWDKAAALILPDTGPIQLGCDVARYGDDMTAIHGRKGGVSLSHEEANGWSVPQTAERCKQVATLHAQRYGIQPRQVLIAVDDCGVGGGVTDLLAQDGWNVRGLNAQEASPDPDFPNLRSALWFGLMEAAATGLVSLIRLAPAVLLALRTQAMAPTYTMDLRGRRCVEPKADTKRRLGRSPDGLDSMMLSYASLAGRQERVAGRVHVH